MTANDNSQSVDDLHDASAIASNKIAELLANAESSIEQLDGTNETAAAHGSDIEGIKKAAVQCLKEIKGFHSAAKANQAGTEELSLEAEALSESIENLKSDNAEKRAELEGIVSDTAAIKDKVEALLPGATSTGLAVSFKTRRDNLIRGRQVWAGIAVAPIVGLICLGLLGPGGIVALTGESELSWDFVLRAIAWRIPVAIPLVWLAIYAGRHHMLALRLEEDYSYKEVLSRSFEGYKREMSDVKATETDTPLSVLCSNILESLSEAPGRIYDKKHRDFTPLNAVLESIDNKTVQKIADKFGVSSEEAIGLIKGLLSK